MICISECQKCLRYFRDDGTGVCPCGFENSWDDEELETQDHLRKITF